MTQRLSILAILLLFPVVTQTMQLNPCAPYSSPSHRNSEVTDRKNVWGERFFNRYQPFDFSENPITMGIEVEFTVPNPKRELSFIRYAELAKIVERKIKKELPDVTVTREKNKIFYEINGEHYQYVLSHETSMDVPPGRIDVEMKSPVLRNKADFDLFYKVLEGLKTKEEVTVSTLTEGLHVHVGVPEIRTSELAMIVSLFAAIERQISEVFPTHVKREKYARNTSEDLLKYLQNTEPNDIHLHKMIELVPTRTHKLNIRSIIEKKLGTLEFRLFNGTVDYRKVQLMVNFATEFIRAIRAKDPRLMEFLSRHQGKSELPFKELAEALELNLP